MTILEKTDLLKPATLILLILANGCTISYKVTTDNSPVRENEISRAEFAEKIHTQHVTITFLDGRQKDAVIAHMPNDSLSIVSRDDTITVAIRDVASVTEKRYFLGALVIFPSSTVGGALIGGLVGQATSSGEGKFWGGLGGFVTGVAIGSVAGLTFGVIIPPKTVFQFSR